MAGETKERILEAAFELFAQSGYSGTSMNDIAKQLGITKGALYKHYTRNHPAPSPAYSTLPPAHNPSDSSAPRSCPGSPVFPLNGGTVRV